MKLYIEKQADRPVKGFKSHLKKTKLDRRKGAWLKVFGVADGARTHDNRNHNPGLYQLSYSHRKA